MKLSLLTFTALLFLSGCSQQSAIDTSTDDFDNSQSASGAHTFILRGTVVIGRESQSIQPCGSDQQYWINLTSEQWKAGTDIQSTPYQSMYGELIGHFEAPPKGGFANDYPARFVVSHINKLVAGEGARCQQPAQPTTASGNEPFWNVQVNKGIFSVSEMGKKAQQQAITDQELSIEQRTYQSDDISLVMDSAICKDTMVDTVYGWASDVTINDKNYQGCASISPKDTTLNWVNTYKGTSTAGNSGLTIGLTLRPDHSAITTYDYQNGEPQLVETGVWQAINENQVHVLMSRHQRQYMIAERTFTRKGNTINAEKETVNGVVFPIQSGLTLFSPVQPLDK